MIARIAALVVLQEGDSHSGAVQLARPGRTVEKSLHEASFRNGIAPGTLERPANVTGSAYDDSLNEFIAFVNDKSDPSFTAHAVAAIGRVLAERHGTDALKWLEQALPQVDRYQVHDSAVTKVFDGLVERLNHEPVATLDNANDTEDTLGPTLLPPWSFILLGWKWSLLVLVASGIVYVTLAWIRG